MLKILLIYPSQLYAPFWGEWCKVKPHMLSLFSFLRYHRINVDVLDLENEIGRPRKEDEVKKFRKKALKLISEFNFDIVGISCWSSLNYLSSIMVADICKNVNPQSTIAVGGYHPSILPHDFMYKKSPFDYIVTGEGETALLRICKKKNRRGSLPIIIQGKPLNLKQQIPNDWKHYRYSTSPLPKTYIYLSRGCIYNCSFCIQLKEYKTWRSYSVARAIEQIKEAVTVLKPKQVAICDACFGLNKIWRRKFLSELIKSKIDTLFWAETRVDSLENEDIDLFSKINFQIDLGLESGSEEMLRIMGKTNKPKEYLKRCEKIIAYLNKKEVPYRIYLIFNHPGETRASIKRSIGFFRSIIKSQNKVSGYLLAQSYFFCPGSRIDMHYDYYAKRFGMVVKHKQWWKERKDQHKLALDIIPSKEFLMKPTPGFNWQKTLEDLNNQCVKKMSPRPGLHWIERDKLFKNYSYPPTPSFD